LPSNDEWSKLYHYADGTSSTEILYDSETAGKYLKATSGWNDYKEKSGNGEDKFGFSALPGAGHYGGLFNNVGCVGYWWSASKDYSYYAYSRFMFCNYENAYWGSTDKSNLFSVRCVRD
jgi:uncharacterized protein (TIGR02145 family)